MPKLSQIFGWILGAGFLLVANRPFSAEAGFVFPLPEGPHKVTSGYEDHHSRLKTVHRSLDLQVAEIPILFLDQVPQDIREKGSRCYSYGTPVLAVQEGEVIYTDDTVEGPADASYGNYVKVRHADQSVALYGHMIRGTNSLYVKTGEKVSAGQILGLMGATGTIITSQPECNKDVPAGTHLHFEARNYFDGNKKMISLEPLGRPENINIKNGQILTSDTVPYDPKNVYAKNHDMKYPYILKLEKVFSIHPLQVASGSQVEFQLTGESFRERTALKIPFCDSQSFRIIDESHAAITCQVNHATGLKEGIFPSPGQPEGILKYQVELQSSPSGSPSVSEVNFISAKPGEFLNLHFLGKNLPGDLSVKIVSKNYPGEEGQCDTYDSFSFLSPGSIKTHCRLPLNLGHVEQKNDQPFTLSVSYQGQVLASKDFDINYGISAANLLPRTALYYTPTRFTISGKNVHRTTVFFIEGCEKKNLKILSQQYDELVLECLIQPKPNTDLSTIDGKTFPHLFLFKTQSRFDEQGVKVFDDEEDRKHVVVSGFIDVTYDREEKVESISPAQAIIGKPTLFTVKGKNLPYGDENPKAYSAWLEQCSAGSQTLQIIPSSYTPYGFDFQCVPEFNKSLLNGKSDFDINKVMETCDNILEQSWTEEEKNKALEKCYEGHNKAVKMSMWSYFDQFFETLAPRKLHVKKSSDQKKILVSEQSVQFISSLYDFMKHEEVFQFQYQREDGEYANNGPAEVKKVLAGEITRKNRHQTITVLGENLPRSLDMASEECTQRAITYGSSEHFEFVCLLKKVPVQEIHIIDSSKQTELSRTYTDLVEVYEVEASPAGNKTTVHLRGVNFTPTISLSSGNCLNFTSIREPSSSEMAYQCDLSAGIFSSSDSLDVKVSSADGVLLFDGIVTIDPQLTPIAGPTIPQLSSPEPAPPSIPEVSVVLADEPLFQSKLITLVCEASDDDAFFLGECRMSSDFIREAFVNASYDKQVRLAVMEGSFDTRLGKAVDDFAANNLLGLKLNPASGNGLIILNIDDQSLLMNGQVKAIGFDASEVLGFPFAFDLYDYQGQLIVTYPYFDVNKTRVKSKIVFGIGQVPGEHITLFQKESDELKKKIEENMKVINVALNKKKIEIGAKLVGSIENTTLKKLARTSYIKILKALEIVPDAVGFYDNYDFIAKGRLKSEPFRPPSWPEDSSWALEANLATVDVDFSAKEAQLTLKGDALNSLSLLNNDILKTDRGLINLGLTVALNRDNGRIDLDRVEVRLPGDFANAKAEAHVMQIFKPEDLTIWGNIKSQIGIGPLELARSGAGFRYDPNMEYWVGNQKTLGLLQLETQMRMSVLMASGKAVFTLPEREELVMDIGGALDLEFLGFNKRLGDALGRGRIHSEYLRACFNSQTGEFVIKIPFYKHLPVTDWLTSDTIVFKGGVSIDTQVDISNKDGLELNYVALSGQGNDSSRIGFRYDHQSSLWNSLSEYNHQCPDDPGQDFLKNILAREMPAGNIIASKSSLFSKPSPMLLASVATEPTMIVQSVQEAQIESEEEVQTLQLPRWDLNGWKFVIPVDQENKNLIVVLDKDGNEVELHEWDYKVPGLLKYEDPYYYIINDEPAFLASGYRFAIKKVDDKPLELGVASYEKEIETSNKYILSDFETGLNSLNFENVEETKNISLNNQPVIPFETKIRDTSELDLDVEAEVSSEELNIPDEPAPQLPATSFPDIKSPLLREAVAYLNEREIISGYPDGTFQPDRVINRAEALKIIFASIGVTPDELSNQDPFTDVGIKEWYAPYVMEAKFRGIIQGYDDGTYRPRSEVNKVEFLKIALSAQFFFSSPSNFSSALRQYSDLDKSQWYMPFVTFAVEHGYLDNTTKLRPTEGMTRGEAAMIIYRILKEQE